MEDSNQISFALNDNKSNQLLNLILNTLMNNMYILLKIRSFFMFSEVKQRSLCLQQTKTILCRKAIRNHNLDKNCFKNIQQQVNYEVYFEDKLTSNLQRNNYKKIKRR